MRTYNLILVDINLDVSIASDEQAVPLSFETKEEAVAAGMKLLEDDEVGEPDMDQEEVEFEEELLGALQVFVCRFTDAPEIWKLSRDRLDMSRVAMRTKGKTDALIRMYAEGMPVVVTDEDDDA